MNAETSLSLPQGRMQGHGALMQAVRDAFRLAAQKEWREMILCDKDFSDWPLGEREVVESLQAWATKGRRFAMLAMDYAEMPRRHARFVRWRQIWGHIIDCRVCATRDPQTFPSVLWTPSWVMQRIDPVHDVLVCDSEAARRVGLRQELDERWRNSGPGFSASVLGL